MNDLIDFINGFIRAEYEALVAQYTEREEKGFLEKKALADGFLAPRLESGIQRPSQPGEEWYEDGKFIIDTGQLIPRILFQVKLYAHPTFGEVFRAYLSNNNRPRKRNPRYFNSFFIAKLAGSYKIVSFHHLETLPPERGSVRFKDNGLVWLWSGGEQFRKLGKPVEMRKFQPPDDPGHLAEYEAE